MKRIKYTVCIENSPNGLTKLSQFHNAYFNMGYHTTQI